MIPAQAALKLLRDGNARFVSDARNDDRNRQPPAH